MKHQGESQSEFQQVAPDQIGYQRQEVDAFFLEAADRYEQLLTDSQGAWDQSLADRVRQIIFSEEAGGYQPADVDRVLSVLEDRLAEMERRYLISSRGQAYWQEHVQELESLLLGRIKRPEKQRFRRPSQKLIKGYFTRDVDRLCDRILAHLEGEEPLTLEDVRLAAFRASTGDMSYDETQVDAFLDRCVQYLQATL